MHSCESLISSLWQRHYLLIILIVFQVKVREATSNDPWGPSSTQMSEIADLTYNMVAFSEIMQMIWKRLNDHGKNWRHVYKALVLLEYLIKTGSEKVQYDSLRLHEYCIGRLRSQTIFINHHVIFAE